MFIPRWSFLFHVILSGFLHLPDFVDQWVPSSFSLHMSKRIKTPPKTNKQRKTKKHDKPKSGPAKRYTYLSGSYLILIYRLPSTWRRRTGPRSAQCRRTRLPESPWVVGCEGTQIHARQRRRTKGGNVAPRPRPVGSICSSQDFAFVQSRNNGWLTPRHNVL